MNIADEAKAGSPICSTFEALVVRCVVGCCHGDRALSVDQCQLQVGSFQCILICYAYFSDVMVLLGFRKL